MSDCCSSNCQLPTPAESHSCPQCGAKCRSVNVDTMLHQLQRPWARPLDGGPYFFCAVPGCDLVYFSPGGGQFSLADLRQPVGQKQTGDERLLCYCFGVRLQDYRVNPEVRDFVVAQTKAGVCACASRNPSGRCCLVDFSKAPAG